MKKTILAVAVAILSSSAMATQIGGTTNRGGDGGAGIGFGGDANQAQGQGQLQGQAQGQGQLQGQAQSNRNNNANLQGQTQSSRNDNTNVNANLNANSNRNSLSNRSTNINANSSRSNSASFSGAAASSYSGGNSMTQGNSQSMTYNEATGMRYSGSYDVKSVGYAPDIIATPTSPCRISVGASAGWMGGAFGFGGSVLDEGCDAREDSRMLYNAGEKAASIARLCQKPEMAKALGPDKCPSDAPAPVGYGKVEATPVAKAQPQVVYDSETRKTTVFVH